MASAAAAFTYLCLTLSAKKSNLEQRKKIEKKANEIQQKQFKQ